MAGFTASWMHGNAVVMEQRGAESNNAQSFDHFGWGTQIQMRPGFDAWFHIPIPAPVILDNQRMKLIRVFLGFEQIAGHRNSGSIADVHLWDGRNRVAMQSAGGFKSSGVPVMDGFRTFELRQPKEWFFGVGLSFLLRGHGFMDGHFIENRDGPWIVIGSAGADFQV